MSCVVGWRKSLWPLGFFLLWSAVVLAGRWREEARDRRVAVMADWNEFRELAARTSRSDEDLLQSLRGHGLTAVFLAPSTLADLYSQRRLSAARRSFPGETFDVRRLVFREPEMARQAYRALSARGVPDLVLQNRDRLLSRRTGAFS